MSVLEQFLVTQLFTFLLIFTRMGSGLMVLPGFGESYVNVRARLMLGFAIAVLMTPILERYMPPLPASPLALFILLAGEILIGIMIGTVARILVSTMHVAGTLISTQAGLSLATQFDLTQATQGTVIGNLLSMTAVIVLFALDLHLVMLRGLSDSYTLFMPGDFPPIEDFINYIASLVGMVFELAFKLSAPIIVIGLLLYYGIGVLSRLMPAMQVLFIIMPAQILLSLFLLAAVFAVMITNFTNFFSDVFVGFLEDFP